MHVTPPEDALGKGLLALSRLFAVMGGIVLVGVTLMSVTSIVGREVFRKPIQGDFELTSLAVAACVAAFLPYCQFAKSNIIVDFFTTGLSRTAQNRLDAVGAVILAIVMFLATWRTGAGMLGVKNANETSMIMGVPIWLSYAFMTPGFLLTGIVALYTAWESWVDKVDPSHNEADDIIAEADQAKLGSQGSRAS
jgi:TRAP-type C4-dicarboxylate transport system permease small subunit